MATTLKPRRKPAKRAMTKADICNVEAAPLDEILGVFRMLSKASHDQLDALENDEVRWTVVDGREVV